MRVRLAILGSVCILSLVFVVWHVRSTRIPSQPTISRTSTDTSPAGGSTPSTPESAPTAVYAHNLMLRKGPDFRIYVRWLRGNMVRTRRDVNPTFDDPESFLLEIKTGVIRANIGDIGNFLNAGGVANSPLRNIMLRADGNDIFFDTLKLLPPPHIHGQLTKVRVVTPDIEEVYGNAEQDVTRVEQWRNFLRLNDGTIDFGKLTMHHVDLTMVDLSNDDWFDLDLNNYQNQLVNVYTRLTPEAGLQIFMPDLDTLPRNKGVQSISLEWLKHRNLPPP